MIAPTLFKGHFQTAYVVENVEAAITSMKRDFGIPNWNIMDMVSVHGPEATVRTIGMAWIGDMMIELLEPERANASIYATWRTPEDQPLKLHHLGFFADTPEDMTAARAKLAESGYPTVVEGSFGTLLEFAYVDTTAAVGHYYELIRPSAEGRAFFDNVPVN